MRLYECDGCGKVTSNRSEMRTFHARFTLLDSDGSPASIEHSRTGEYCMGCAPVIWTCVLNTCKNIHKKENKKNE